MKLELIGSQEDDGVGDLARHAQADHGVARDDHVAHLVFVL